MSNEQQYGPHKSSIGDLDANVMALLTYFAAAIIGLIPYLGYIAFLAPLVLFFIEKNSRFVKFHAAQAFSIQLVGAAAGFVLRIIFGTLLVGLLYNPIAAASIAGILALLAILVSIVILVFCIIAAINAYNYKIYKIPVISKLAAIVEEKLGNR